MGESDAPLAGESAPTMCSERVSEPPGYWHDHGCSRKAKWLVKSPTSVDPRPVCTQHRKWFDRNGTVIGPVPSGRHNDEASTS